MSEGGISVVIFIFGACAIAAPVDKISQVAAPIFNASQNIHSGSSVKVGTWCPKDTAWLECAWTKSLLLI
jgi:hypothetical protein